MDGAVLRLGAVDGMGRCSGVGRCSSVGGGQRGAVLRHGVVLQRCGGRGWRGVEMNWDNFNPRHFYSSELITAGSACKPTVMGHITAGSLPKSAVMCCSS